jgi:hypothetical protein
MSVSEYQNVSNPPPIEDDNGTNLKKEHNTMQSE